MTSDPGDLPHETPHEPSYSWLPILEGRTESADWNRDLIEHSHDLLCIHDLNGNLLSVNPRPAELLGYSVKELIRIPMRNLVPTRFQPGFDEYLKNIVHTGEANGLFVVLTRDGEERIWEFHNTLRTEGVPTPLVRGVAHDVTHRVRIEKELREGVKKLAKLACDQVETVRALQLFRTLLDHSNDAIEVIDPASMRFLDVNERACLELGYGRDELLSMSLADINPEATPEVFANNLQRVINDGFLTLETVHRRKDGSTFPVEVNIRRVQLDREYLIAVSRNITRRKLRDLRLQEFERVMESLTAMIAVVDRDYRYVLANRAFLQRHGLSLEQVIGHSVVDVLHADAYEYSIKSKLNEAFGGKTVNYELNYTYPELGERRAAVTYLPIDGPRGVDRVAVIIRDVTESRRARAELRESEERFRSLYENSTIGLYRTTPEGKILLANPSLVQMLGFDSFSELADRDLEKGGFEAGYGRAQFRRRLEDEGEIRGLESSWTRKDGTAIFVRESAKAVRNAEGAIAYYEGTVEDVSERRRAEEALRESEERMRLAQQAAGIGVFERNMQTGGSRWSPEMEAIFGLPPGQAPKTVEALMQLVHPEDRELLQQAIDDSIRTGAGNAEWRVIWPDGSQHWISGHWRMFYDKEGRPLRAVGVDIDITVRKHAEQALRESEERLRLALESAQMGSWEYDHLTDATTRNLRHDQIFGHESLVPEWNRDTFLAHIVPEDRAAVKELMEQNWTQKSFSEECRVLWPDQSLHWILTRGRTLADNNGRPLKTLGTVMDITERKRAEQSLRESEERMRLAQEVAGIGTFDRNLATGEVRWTPQLEAMYGLPLGEAPHDIEDFLELVHPHDRKRVAEIIERSLQTGEGNGEWRVVWPNNSVHWITGRWRVLNDAAGKPVRIIGIDYDITRQKRVEHELRQAKERLIEEKLYLEHEIDTQLGFEEIIGQSAPLKAVMESAGRVASSDATVLILGETGTGKELIARAIHRLSGRASGPFIKLNCAAIPSGLLESELFGAEKGAYTGSTSRKIGRLELADKGTLFLDEIGEIALSLQPKLLRVLQDQEFERLGGTRTIKVNFRLVAATNRDLNEQVHDNEFRRDLYYRLNVFPIHLPPLRERLEDIPPLVEHFVQKCAKRMGKSITSIPRNTMDTLAAWHWPGNVRELENFIERSVILTNGSVLAAPLSELQGPASRSGGANDTLEAAERRHILEALRQSRGRIGGTDGAAARLGLKRTTLQSRLKQMKINPKMPPVN